MLSQNCCSMCAKSHVRQIKGGYFGCKTLAAVRNRMIHQTNEMVCQSDWLRIVVLQNKSLLSPLYRDRSKVRPVHLGSSDATPVSLLSLQTGEYGHQLLFLFRVSVENTRVMEQRIRCCLRRLRACSDHN